MCSVFCTSAHKECTASPGFPLVCNDSALDTVCAPHGAGLIEKLKLLGAQGASFDRRCSPEFRSQA